MASTTTTHQPEAKAAILNWADQKDGQFKRQVSSFRDFIGSERFPAEKGRYHLYISWACPWAHRTAIVRKLKGLESVIGLSVVSYLMGKDGWHFSTPEEEPGTIPDTVNGAKLVREIYFKAEPNYNARFTVPILWDTKHETIVNNESSEIIRMLSSEFNAFSSRPSLDLYPLALRPEIDELNAWVYDGINNGVYKSGFASTQDAYESNVYALFAALDRAEAHLENKAWLVGNTLTEADIRLFTTILRFDPVYHGHFKCNLKTISHDYPNLLQHARRVFQLDGVAETVNMTHIKRHYYMSHLQINPFAVVSAWNGPDLSTPVVESHVL
ncbi:glutathione S-transferase [Saprolegnia diclina VS20]|uniref:Glutathione S-transferase n=1 Tax=Saprolegnia diclina (strain VS20) TaxID=1156394 RepID=T0QKT5_SAPDV|nr:glutathione S-transferase [Saprolegnia diclina VS20]EQC35326.1 glutathione S-transferase [Saprolegnia diclina VS20]|eukprot:XP_008611076.1 glutathione S-transferase [Saprolegnia diclina VS20]